MQPLNVRTKVTGMVVGKYLLAVNIYLITKEYIMKLKTFLTAAVVALLFTACSTTYRATDTGVLISADATKAFDQQYPTATNMVWSNYNPDVVIISDWDLADWVIISDDDYMVQFDMDGEKYYAWYDSDGAWVGSAYVINDFTTLPYEIRTSIYSKFPDFTITKANREFYGDRTAYEVGLKRGDEKRVALIGEDGMVIKSKLK